MFLNLAFKRLHTFKKKHYEKDTRFTFQGILLA